MERLAREKIASQQRLSALKKELSAQWDHIDFNALLPPQDDRPAPDGRRPLTSSVATAQSDHYTNSTSTASERGHVSDDGEDAFVPSVVRMALMRRPSPHPLDFRRATPPSSPDAADGGRRHQGQAGPPGIATALVSPSAPIHVLASDHLRHAPGGVVMTQIHPSPALPGTNLPATDCSPPPDHSPQPLELTVHAPVTTSTARHHDSFTGLSLAHESLNQGAKSSLVSTAKMAATISVPTIHLAGKVVQQPVAILGPMTSCTPRSPCHISPDLEAAVMPPSSLKFPISPPQHTLHQQPVAIAGGNITLPNGGVAHVPSSGAGVKLTQAMSPGGAIGRAAAHCPTLPTTLTLAHSPTSGITHLMTPLAGHAALVTTSGGGASGHPMMAPLALVSSTGGPVAAHILGAGSSGPGAAKVISSGAAIPLLKPVAVGPLVNAQYLTTAATLGGLAHLVKPLVVVSSAPSTVSNHHSANCSKAPPVSCPNPSPP